LTVYNPWWNVGKVPEALLLPYRRKVFKDLLQWLEGKRILGIVGPRRTGKTTIMYQLIQYLLTEKEIDPLQILYLSCDDPAFGVFDIQSMFATYEENLLHESITHKQVYVFIDEIQFLKDWARWLKRYHDLKYPVKFIISGSSATYNKSRSKESLVGRIVEEDFYPFSFAEYIECTGNMVFDISFDELSRGDFSNLDTVKLASFTTQLKTALNEYAIRGGFPEYFNEKTFLIWSRLIRSDIVDKTIYKDLVRLYDIKMPSLLESLLVYLAGTSSGIFVHTKASDMLGISRPTVVNYMEYLKSAFLIDEARKYSKSAASEARSAKKTYMIDSGLMNSLLGEPELTDLNKGKIFETLAFNHARSLADSVHYWRHGTTEVDLVLSKNNIVTPIEVKYRENISKSDTKGVCRFMDRYKCQNGIVLTRDTLEKLGSVTLLPVWLFLISR
ncbi:MAG: ATP-binding protein, partial [Candidatus Thermoplasmatota archaeon]|nr:ATP-binding protein [Candidatus Thermoplasmatota archaeon]